MAQRIFVGGLPYSTRDEEVEALFAEYGKVSAAEVVTDRFTGQSRGFAFVEMEDDGEASAAIAALNGSTLGGRTLTVNEARARESRGGGGGRPRGGGGPRW